MQLQAQEFECTEMRAMGLQASTIHEHEALAFPLLEQIQFRT